jgi:hypothetical protein
MRKVFLGLRRRNINGKVNSSQKNLIDSLIFCIDNRHLSLLETKLACCPLRRGALINGKPVQKH